MTTKEIGTEKTSQSTKRANPNEADATEEVVGEEETTRTPRAAKTTSETSLMTRNTSPEGAGAASHADVEEAAEGETDTGTKITSEEKTSTLRTGEAEATTLTESIDTVHQDTMTTPM